MSSGNRFAPFIDLTVREEAALDALAGPPRQVAARRDIRAQGEAAPGLFFLHSGWAISSVVVPDGGRQVLKVHLPGDYLGAPSLVLAAAADTLTALTPVSVSAISLERLGQMFAEHPRLGAAFFLSAQQERAILMNRLTSVGRLGARQKVAALLVHLYERVAHVTGDNSTSIDVPLTQQVMADVLGLTPVHVNRVIRAMEKDGEIVRQGHRLDLIDLARLRRIAAETRPMVLARPTWLPDSR